MKRFIALIVVLTMVLALCACGANESAAPEAPVVSDTPAVPDTPAETPDNAGPVGGMTMGETLKAEFETQVNSGLTDIQQLADILLANSVIEFAGASMPVEPGYLAGFSAEIHDFKQAVMFAPMIGSIAFVGYIFEVEGDTETFVNTLTENADPRWNICVEAAETVTATAGNLVFFVMCP